VSADADLPRFRSMALEGVERPDYVDVMACPLPEGATTDPAVWAATVFSPLGTPSWVKVLMGLRQVLVPLIGVPQGSAERAFAVVETRGEEALMVSDDRHLDFRAALGVDPETRLVRLVTVVRLHGLRGRVYFAPVRVVHPLVVSAMLHRAARRLTP
jgi:hypothetical protein